MGFAVEADIEEVFGAEYYSGPDLADSGGGVARQAVAVAALATAAAEAARASQAQCSCHEQYLLSLGVSNTLPSPWPAMAQH